MMEDRAGEIAVDAVQAEIIRAALKNSWREGWEAASAALGRPDASPAAREGYVQQGLIAAARKEGKCEGLDIDAIAKILTGYVGATCCHVTGGLGPVPGRKEGRDHCGCREAAELIRSLAEKDTP